MENLYDLEKRFDYENGFYATLEIYSNKQIVVKSLVSIFLAIFLKLILKRIK